MSWYKTASTDLASVADAIRTKGGTSSDLTFPGEFVSAIMAIPTGGSNMQTKSQSFTPSTTAQTATITPDGGYDGLSSVTVTVTAMTTQVLPTAVSSSGSGTLKVTVSRSTSDQYINIPVGWNDSTAYYKISAVPNGTAGTPTATKGAVNNHSIAVTPSVTNSTGYISGGTKAGTAVTVSASELVSGTKEFTANTTSADVTNYKYVKVNVATTTINNQTKSVTPTTSEQVVTADTGYTGLESVTVAAITTMTLPTAPSSAYSGTSKATVTVSTADQYINIPIGWNASSAYYKIEKVTWQEKTVTPSGVEQRITADTGYTALTKVTVSPVPSGVATAPSMISASSATVQTAGGLFVLSAWADVTPDVTTPGYVSTGTAGSSLVTMQADIAIRSSSDVSVSGSTVTVSSGYYGSPVSKTVSGGGGVGTLLKTTSLGSLSTSSTSASDTGKTMTLTGYNDYDLLIVDVSVDTLTNGRHTSTVSTVYLTGTSNVNTKNTYNVGSNKWNSKLNSSGTGTTRQSSTAYGIYVNAATVSGSTMTLTFYYRYNNNNTGTINGNYTARVYGVKLYELIGG